MWVNKEQTEINHSVYLFQIQYRGMIATATGIVREEGAMKLWRGVTPALYRHLVYRYDLWIISLVIQCHHSDLSLFSGVRIAVYDKLRKKFGASDNSGLPLWQAAISGVTAGGLAQW